MRLLIIGKPHPEIFEATRIAHSNGAKVSQTNTISSAMESLRNGRGADLIMVDVEEDIAQLIAALEAERFAIPVIGCGTKNDARAAVKAIQAGAKEYVPLPPDAELISAVLQAVSEEEQDFIYSDETMHKTIRLAEQIATSDASVLISGESGTGKERIAQHIHKKSKRAKGPFIAINCAAIPEHLLESELFGHEKGAFTGAVARKLGKFEEANGGTLLLDEISEMDIRLQAKLLRAIQERVIDRVGGKTPVPVDIRILATTNVSMEKAIKNGTFREDLFYRLNVVNLRLPPLRERPNDIETLAVHFEKKYATTNGLNSKRLSEAALNVLKSYHWPGNVRELENTLHRAVLLSTEQDIEALAIRRPSGESLHDTTSTPRPSPADQMIQKASDVANAFVGATVAEVERTLILNTLDHCLGNRTHTANILGISIRTLRNKLNEYAQGGYDIPNNIQNKYVAQPQKNAASSYVKNL